MVMMMMMNDDDDDDYDNDDDDNDDDHEEEEETMTMTTAATMTLTGSSDFSLIWLFVTSHRLRFETGRYLGDLCFNMTCHLFSRISTFSNHCLN